MPLSASSRSADGATIAPLLPPSSRMQRPSRCATVAATARPIGTEPVAETIATSRFSASAAPSARPPTITCVSPAGASGPNRAIARSQIFCTASAVSGVFSDGFHSTGSPQTSASAAFHDQGATGKLNAVMTPHTPIGCQLSRIE